MQGNTRRRLLYRSLLKKDESDLKQKLKYMLSLLGVALASPVIVCFYLGTVVFNKNAVFSAASQYLSLIPGVLGSYCRKGFYSVVMTSCDLECVIGFGTIFSQQDTEIGEGVYIGPQCNIGKSRIEKNCLFCTG